MWTWILIAMVLGVAVLLVVAVIWTIKCKNKHCQDGNMCVFGKCEKNPFYTGPTINLKDGKPITLTLNDNFTLANLHGGTKLSGKWDAKNNYWKFCSDTARPLQSFCYGDEVRDAQGNMFNAWGTNGVVDPKTMTFTLNGKPAGKVTRDAQVKCQTDCTNGKCYPFNKRCRDTWTNQ